MRAVRLVLAGALAGMVMLSTGCVPEAVATPAAASSTVVEVGPLRAASSARQPLDRGGPPPVVIGETVKQDRDLSIRAWVSRTELTPEDELGVFAQVERAGKPLSNALVLMILGGTTSEGFNLTRLQTGPDGLATTKLSAKIFRVGQSGQILLSVSDGGDVLDAELRVAVEPGGDGGP